MTPQQISQLLARIGDAEVRVRGTTRNSLVIKHTPMSKTASVRKICKLTLSKHSVLRGKSFNKENLSIISRHSRVIRLRSKNGHNQVWVILSITRKLKTILRARSAMYQCDLAKARHLQIRWTHQWIISRHLRVILPWCRSSLVPLEREQR